MNKRPKLNKNINFKDFYWLKEELVDFCRGIGINRSGGKIDIANRITEYLRTGKIESKNPIKGGKNKKGIQKTPENINEVIPDNYTSSQLFREYFESIIGQHFHFTAYMAKYIKDHSGKRELGNWGSGFTNSHNSDKIKKTENR